MIKNKLIIAGILYSKLIKIITTIISRLNIAIAKNLFLQFLISSEQSFDNIIPVKKLAISINK